MLFWVVWRLAKSSSALALLSLQSLPCWEPIQLAIDMDFVIGTIPAQWHHILTATILGPWLDSKVLCNVLLARLSSFAGMWPHTYDQAAGSFHSGSSPEYLSMIAGEAANPRKTVPRAFNTIIYRLVAFYVLGAICVGVVGKFKFPHLSSIKLIVPFQCHITILNSVRRSATSIQ